MSAARASSAGMDTIALFEAIKGALVLIVGFGLLEFAHRDVQAIAAELVHHLHLDPASKYPKIFLALSARLADANLWLLAIGAAVYALIRFAEAYGLWRGAAWAKWLGALSGAIYIPFEIIELARGVSTLKLATFSVNVVVVAYLSYSLYRGRNTVAEYRSNFRG